MAANRNARSFEVVIQKPAGSNSDDSYVMEREALEPIGAKLVEIDAESEEAFAEAARSADAVIGRNRRITASVIARLERCKVIGLSSIGTDTVDVEAATRHGIVVTNVPDVFIEEVADHTLAMLLSAYRQLPLMHRMMQEGRWAEGRPRLSMSPRLWGMTLGLISFGNVARAVARRARPFGLRVLAYDPYVSEVEMTAAAVEPETSLSRLLERSDFVSMHAPLNEETRHMLSDAELARMKPTAVLVNNGRGPTIDEAALVRALDAGRIAGAALDVFEIEPLDPSSSLLHRDNVLCSPHVASATARMAPESRRRLGREIASVLLGRWPRSVVNPGVMPNTELVRWQPYSHARGPNR